MQDPKDKKIISRYFTIIILMAVVGIIILLKAMSVMVFERNYWKEVASHYIVDSVAIVPRRGNILSDDGLLMASSVPQYTLFMDFMVRYIFSIPACSSSQMASSLAMAWWMGPWVPQ